MNHYLNDDSKFIPVGYRYITKIMQGRVVDDFIQEHWYSNWYVVNFDQKVNGTLDYAYERSSFRDYHNNLIDKALALRLYGLEETRELCNASHRSLNGYYWNKDDAEIEYV